MANYLSLFSNRQFIDANGNPYSGAKLFTYSVGSSTKVTTYKNEAGSASHANPIILNTKGEPADGSGVAYPIWQIGGTAVKYVLVPSTDTDPPASPIETWDNIDGINDTSITVDQWISGATPTYVSATSLTLVGDQTSTYHIGRRIKTTNSGGTIYSTITNSVYGALTTLTLVNDSGTLDSGLSAISYGVLSSSNGSIPAVVTSGLSWRHQGSIWSAEGAAVASTADCNIWTTDGNTVHITGTTQIDDWGTAPQAGSWKRVIFDGVLTLNYNATTNDIPGDEDLTTSANDSCIVYARSASSYQIFDYTPASGNIIARATGTAATYLGVATFSPTINVNVGDIVAVNIKFTGVMNGANAFLEEVTIGESGAGTCVLEFYPSQSCILLFGSHPSHGSGSTVSNSYTVTFKVITAGTLIAVGGIAVSESGTAPTVKASYVTAEVRRSAI